MGSSTSRPKSAFTKIDLQILSKFISQTIALKRDRKVEELLILEKNITAKTQSRNISKEEAILELLPVIILYKHIKAFNIVISYFKIIVESSESIIACLKSKDYKALEIYETKLNGIVMICKELKIDQSKEYKEFFEKYFPEKVYKPSQENPIEKELAFYYSTKLPGSVEKGKYFEDFCRRNRLFDENFLDENRKDGRLSRKHIPSLEKRIPVSRKNRSESGEKEDSLKAAEKFFEKQQPVPQKQANGSKNVFSSSYGQQTGSSSDPEAVKKTVNFNFDGNAETLTFCYKQIKQKFENFRKIKFANVKMTNEDDEECEEYDLDYIQVKERVGLMRLNKI